MGMLPYAMTFPVEGLEGMYDSIGFYRLSEDGGRYVSVYDPNVSYAVRDVPTDIVIPAVESTSRPQRSLWGRRPEKRYRVFRTPRANRFTEPGPRAQPARLP